jgi:hypothetical protein
MSGLVIVESMYREEVELNLTCGDHGLAEAASGLSPVIGLSACRAVACAAVSGRRLAAARSACARVRV